MKRTDTSTAVLLVGVWTSECGFIQNHDERDRSPALACGIGFLVPTLGSLTLHIFSMMPSCCLASLRIVAGCCGGRGVGSVVGFCAEDSTGASPYRELGRGDHHDRHREVRGRRHERVKL